MALSTIRCQPLKAVLVLLFSALLVLGFVFRDFFCCVCEFGNGEDGRAMTTRITPGVGANLLGQHAAERNQDATAYVGNLDSQVLLFLKLCFVCRQLRLMLWLTFYFWHCNFWEKYIVLSQALFFFPLK